MPSSALTPRLFQQGEHAAETAFDQMQAAGETCRQGSAPGNGCRIAVDGPKRAIRFLEDGGRVAGRCCSCPTTSTTSRST